jgi:hypothetical protein
MGCERPQNTGKSTTQAQFAILVFFEHVRVHRPLAGRLQDWLTPLWKRLAGGCHLNRNTLVLITQVGFDVTCIAPYYKELFLVIE